MADRQLRTVSNSDAPDVGEETDRLERIDPSAGLRPGEYWRARRGVEFLWPSRWEAGQMDVIYEAAAGEVLVIAEIRKDGENDHAIDLLPHPLKRCAREAMRMLLSEFLEAFEFAPDGEAVRAREIETLNVEIRGIQADIERAHANPAYLNAQALKAIAQKASETALPDGEAGLPARAGDVTVLNILSVETPNLLQSMATLKPGDVPAAIEMVRSAQVLAQAQAQWFKQRTELMAERTKLIVGFYTERAQVGIARMSEMVSRSKTLLESLATMTLFTGEGVTVSALVDGAPAVPGTPVRLFQRKLWVDEEASYWSEYAHEMTLDARNAETFVQMLREYPGLVEQLIPAPRGAVLMGWSQRNKLARDPIINALLVKASATSWVLIRDGERLMMVTSPVDSHAKAARLFPERDVDGTIFGGVDGHRVTAEDLRYSDKLDELHNLAVHYRRFSVLLAGLISREEVWGDIDYRDLFHAHGQAKVLELVFDDSGEDMIADGRVSLAEYLQAVNRDVRAGVRVVIDMQRAAADPEVVPGAWRQSGRDAWQAYRPEESFIIETLERAGDDLFVRARFVHRHEPDKRKVMKVYHTHAGSQVLDASSFMCFDALDPAELDRLMQSRKARSSFLEYMPLFKAAKRARLEAHTDEARVREWIRDALQSSGLCSPEESDHAIEQALVAWRATGSPIPTPEAPEATNLLNHVYAVTRSAGISPRAVEALAMQRGLTPLRLSVDRRGRSLLYTDPRVRDDRGYQQLEVERWRVARSSTGLRLTPAAPAILHALSVDETVIHDWPNAEGRARKGQVELTLAQKNRLIGAIESQLQIGRQLLAGPISNPRQAMDWFMKGYESQRRHVGRVTYPVIAIPIALLEMKSGKAQVMTLEVDAVEALVRNLPAPQADELANWWIAKFDDKEHARGLVQAAKNDTSLDIRLCILRARDARFGSHPIERCHDAQRIYLQDPEQHFGTLARLHTIHAAFTKRTDGLLTGFATHSSAIRQFWAPAEIGLDKQGGLERWLLRGASAAPAAA